MTKEVSMKGVEVQDREGSVTEKIETMKISPLTREEEEEYRKVVMGTIPPGPLYITARVYPVLDGTIRYHEARLFLMLDASRARVAALEGAVVPLRVAVESFHEVHAKFDAAPSAEGLAAVNAERGAIVSAALDFIRALSSGAGEGGR